MQTRSSKWANATRTPVTPRRAPLRHLIAGSWAVLTALIFLVFLEVGVHERAALPLVAIVACTLAAELVAGVVCLVKGYRGVGWVALGAWLTYPVGAAISSAVSPQSREPALLGSAIGAGVILVVAALAVVTAPRPARWGSRWERAGWGRHIDRG